MTELRDSIDAWLPSCALCGDTGWYAVLPERAVRCECDPPRPWGVSALQEAYATAAAATAEAAKSWQAFEAAHPELVGVVPSMAAAFAVPFEAVEEARAAEPDDDPRDLPGWVPASRYRGRYRRGRPRYRPRRPIRWPRRARAPPALARRGARRHIPRTTRAVPSHRGGGPPSRGLAPLFSLPPPWYQSHPSQAPPPTRAASATSPSG